MELRYDQVVFHYKDSRGPDSGKQEINVDEIYQQQASYLNIEYDTAKKTELLRKLSKLTAKLKISKPWS